MEKPRLVLPLSNHSNKRRLLNSLLILLVILLSFGYLEIDVIESFRSMPDFILFFFQNFFPANFTNLPSYLPLVAETILFAIVGTYISAVLAFVFGLLMSEQTNPYPLVRTACRMVISFLRNIPVLVWASLFVYIFGIGNMVGLLALTVATLGFLARSYADSIDEIGSNKLEALRATGASYWQILFHGLIPEFIPSWINWTLFSFEINIRASSILGMVGAGGMGIMIQTNIRLFKYREAFALIILLVLLVLLTEFVVNQLRKRIA
ncbi:MULTISPECIES: phosphonate ABC transporter, permease protein PhnE [unclassified Enterococcus]|uniref:phosphonate ABC transporter, permease protein PhnE n=1 Tax=unclassified Enterococcus TaxID=2608891 RepID=UPI001A9BCB6E|nr:phosphonate ABC transporter, permease protein PhnE [Enterococcus sp. DIV1271a]MBO1300059.1 phosphonate ABC transporter, permease protein PhnE [Enterococcus sp. DIV1271a]